MDPLQQPEVDLQFKNTSSNSRKWAYAAGVIVLLMLAGFFAQKYYFASWRNVPAEPVQKRLLSDVERAEIQKQLAPTTQLSVEERNKIQKELAPTASLTDAERIEIQNQLKP
ncbi:MAG: hypothetical protein WC757_00585 [Candidatus Paceibacterota bacterium]|jgi:hypothetical protein